MTNAPACAVGDAHRRLLDLHADLHAMVRSYMDPYEFRRALNTALQDARSVTFLLQKRKSQLPDFDQWYSEWVETVRADPVMRWSIDSRNRVVKEHDLALSSTLQLEYRQDWLTGSDTIISEDPMLTLDQIAGLLAHLSVGRASGILTVRRQWIDQAASSSELVEVMTWVFANLSTIVRKAHEARDQDGCDPGVRGSFPCPNQMALGVLPCLGDGRWSRVTVDLTDGSLFEWEAQSFVIDPAGARAAASKYGAEQLPSLPAVELADVLMDTASRVLRVDEFHGAFAFLTRGSDRVQLAPTVSTDKKELMLRMEELARDARVRGADGILHVGEMWVGAMDEIQAAQLAGLAPAESASPFYGPDLIPGRAEALAVTALQADGRRRFLQRRFIRHADGIELEAIEDLSGAVPNFLMPFARLWGVTVE